MPATLRVDVSIPKSETKSIEVKWCDRALQLAGHAIRRAGGQATSGDITGDGGILLGSWVYTPQAKS
jgi:hypothetical protein